MHRQRESHLPACLRCSIPTTNCRSTPRLCGTPGHPPSSGERLPWLPRRGRPRVVPSHHPQGYFQGASYFHPHGHHHRECSLWGFSIVLTKEDTIRLFGTLLHISYLTSVDQNNRKLRLICNSGKAPDEVTLAVNASLDNSFAPKAMQFCPCLAHLND